MAINIGGLDPTGVGSYNGYPGSKYWNVDSRPLSDSTNVLRSFVLQNIVQDNQWEIDRITRYYLFWKFYKGQHYKDFNDGLLSFNYVRAFIDKVIMFLLGNDAFSFHVKSLYTEQIDPEIEKNAEQLMMYHWTRSGKESIAYEMLQMGSITGDLWVGVNWVNDDLEGDYCKVSVFDSRQCFPQFKNGDFSTLSSFMVRQVLDGQQLNRDNSQIVYKLRVIKYTPDTIETWYQDNVCIEEAKATKYEYQKAENPYGFIPVVHIKNKPNAESYYGISDENDILKINKIYNELGQQLKAVIDYHVTPTTVITGASARSLKRGLGQIWSGLPAEANVFNLGLDVDLSAATNFMALLKTAMHELSDVPENALGKIQPISNTSAAALTITYHPLMQQANLKAIMYGSGIRLINKMMMREIQIMNPDDERLQNILELNPDFMTECQIDPVFAYGFPKDKMDELQRAQLELQMKLGSRREIMERMGKQNIDELLKAIDDDTIQQAMVQVKVNQLVEGMGMNNENGDENQNEEGEEGISEEPQEENPNEEEDSTDDEGSSDYYLGDENEQ